MNINIPSSCINSNFTANQDGAAKAAAQTQVHQTSEAMMKTANMTKLSNDLKDTAGGQYETPKLSKYFKTRSPEANVERQNYQTIDKQSAGGQ